MSSAFGSGPSNGQFWFGGSSFPGFLYKKNVGVGGRRSTKMNPGGNITCNSATYLYNKYTPGGSGVGASSMSNRRAKNRLATVCRSGDGSNTKNCFPCQPTLGQYSNYTHNPNGFIPCPSITTNIISSVIPTPTPPTPPGGPYTVTYLGNTNTGGSAPTDGSSPYISGTSVTILGNSGSLTKSGVAVFAGWNTAADGSGTNYVGGDTFNITQNTNLYARWITAGSRLRYNAGTGGFGTAPSSSGTYYTPFSSANIVGNTGSFTNTTSPVFAGWNTLANGTGTSYPVGSNITMPSSGNVDLYAQWIPVGGPFILTYNAGTGGTGTPPSSSGNSYSAGSPANVVGNTGSFTNATSPVFNGWNTLANGTGTSYPAGSKITMTTNTTLYAQWGSSPPVTVTYNGNGATGTIPTQTYPTGAQSTILGQSSLTRPGYSFLGWNSAANGTGSVYIPTSSVVINSSITLYAQWAPGTAIKDCGNFTGDTQGTSNIYLSGGRTVFRDNTTNTITIIIPTFYSVSPGAPYGTGNGQIDTAHSGNLKSTYATATISQVLGVYQINITYTAAYTGGTYTQTSTLSLGSTYWPTTETISTVTIPAPNNPAAFQFDPAGTNISVSGGCFGGASAISSSGTTTTTQNSVISFYINFSNGTSTRVALGTQQRWTGTANPYTYIFNYTRTELANGTTPSPITGPFTPTSSTGVNTPNV
jgi:uncharacterized repeat protein (TIGR02543 family)